MLTSTDPFTLKPSNLFPTLSHPQSCCASTLLAIPDLLNSLSLASCPLHRHELALQASVSHLRPINLPTTRSDNYNVDLPSAAPISTPFLSAVPMTNQNDSVQIPPLGASGTVLLNNSTPRISDSPINKNQRRRNAIGAESLPFLTSRYVIHFNAYCRGRKRSVTQRIPADVGR